MNIILSIVFGLSILMSIELIINTVNFLVYGKGIEIKDTGIYRGAYCSSILWSLFYYLNL